MVGVASTLALAWAVLVWVSGGTTIAVAGLRVSSTDPVRPMIVALVLAAIYAGRVGTAASHRRCRVRAPTDNAIAACRTARSRNRHHRHRSVVVHRIRRRRVRLRHTGRPAALGQAHRAGPDRQRGALAPAALDICAVWLRRGGQGLRDRFCGRTRPAAAHGAVQGDRWTHSALSRRADHGSAADLVDVRHRTPTGLAAARPRCGMARRHEPGVPHHDQGADERRASRGILGTCHVEGSRHVANERSCGRSGRGNGDPDSTESRTARRCARRMDAVAASRRTPVAIGFTRSSSSRYRSYSRA